MPLICRKFLLKLALRTYILAYACIWKEEIQAISELRKQLQQYAVKLFDCNHLAHVIVLWQMQKFTCFFTVFALLYFEGNFQVQASGGLYLEGLIFGILRYYECHIHYKYRTRLVYRTEY